MMTLTNQILVGAAVSCLATALLTPRVARLALQVGAVDRPGGRKRHQGTIPRLGGIPVIVGVFVGLGCVWLAAEIPLPSPWPEGLSAFMVGTTLVFGVGLVDDLWGVPPLLKLGMQVLAAVVLVAGSESWVFGQVGLPGGSALGLGALALPVTVLWIVGVCNAINLVDGMDGLATGVIGIIAGSFVVYSLLLGAELVAVSMACILGAAAGFLVYNRPPAKIFLGDTGSLTLGFLLAALSVRTAFKLPVAVGILVPLLALGLPAIDAILVAVARFFGTPSRPTRARIANVLRADRSHLHHLLKALLRENRRVVAAVYAGVALSAAAALAVVITRSAILGFSLFVGQVLVLAGIRVTGMQRRAQERALRARQLLRRDLMMIQETAVSEVDEACDVMGPAVSAEAPATRTRIAPEAVASVEGSGD